MASFASSSVMPSGRSLNNAMTWSAIAFLPSSTFCGRGLAPLPGDQGFRLKIPSGHGMFCWLSQVVKTSVYASRAFTEARPSKTRASKLGVICSDKAVPGCTGISGLEAVAVV